MNLIHFLSRISLVFVTTIVTFSECREVYNYAVVNCYITHLKSIKKLSEDFPEHNVSSEEEEDCAEFIRIIREESFENFVTTNDYESSSVIEGLKEKLWFEYGLLETVYEASETLKKSEVIRKAKEAETLGEESLIVVGKFCELQKILETLFDEIFENESEGNKDIEDFCVRKYAVDEHLIDTSEFTVDLNPNHADISNVDCEGENSKYFKKFEEDFLEGIKEEVEKTDQKTQVDAECALKKLSEANLIDELVKLRVLSKLEITKTQKKDAKNEFVKSLQKIYEKCIYGF